MPVTVREPISLSDEVSVTPVFQPSQLSSDFSPNQQLTYISQLFKSYCSLYSGISLPDDFLQLSVSAMEHLKSCSRSNILYGLAKTVGTMRPDQSDSLMPAKRMPMGLVEHVVNFFGCSSIHQV